MARFAAVMVVAAVALGESACTCGAPAAGDAGRPDSGTDAGPTNRPPTAADDAAQTPQRASVLVAVTANDSDPDGDALTVTSVDTPPNGTASIEGASIRYTPAATFSGVDAFGYVVGDGRGGTARATVTVTVVRLPSPIAVGPAAGSAGNLIVFGPWVPTRVLVDRSDAGAATALLAPRWSPDGGWLAFLSEEHAWIAKADGSQPRMLPEPITSTSLYQGYVRDVQWSPDGTRLAVVGVEVGSSANAVFVVRADGTTGYQLAAIATSAHWTPGSDGLLFSALDATRGARVTYLHPLDGGANVELAEGEVVAVSGSGTIVLSRREVTAPDGGAREPGLWLLEPGRAPRPLASGRQAVGPSSGDEATFSPAGDAVAVRATVLDVNGNAQAQVGQLIALDGGVTTFFDSAVQGMLVIPQCLRWVPGAPTLSYQVPDEGPLRVKLLDGSDGGLDLGVSLRSGYPQLVCHDWRLE